MNINILIITVNAFIFLLLAGIHFYWAIGGRVGLEQAIPSAYKDRFAIMSTKKIYFVMTMIICISLLLFGWVMLAHLGDIGIQNEVWLRGISITLGGVFLVRAIGDFNTCGFFKLRGRDAFSKWDSWLYSPLCFYLGTSIFLIIN